MKFLMVILLAIGWIVSTTLASPVFASTTPASPVFASTTPASPTEKVNATTLYGVLKDVTSALRPLQKLHDDLVGKFDKAEEVVELPLNEH